MPVRGCSPGFHNGASNGVLCLIRVTARYPVVSLPRHSSDVPVGRWPVAQRFERQRVKKLKNVGKIRRRNENRGRRRSRTRSRCASCGVWQISKRSWEKDKQKGGARTALHAQQQQQNARNTRNARTQHTQQTQCTHAQQQHGEKGYLVAHGYLSDPRLEF